MVLAAALAGYMVSLQLARGTPQLASGTTLPTPRPVTPFTLTDQHGASFGNAQLLGKPHLVFFGFTHCPDVCPTTLALMAQLLRDPELAHLRMLFITVDPQRDDQQTLLRYVEAFGGGFAGLRGADDQLDLLMNNLGAARSIAPRVGTDYAVDHSATLFYINSRAAFSAVFTPPYELEKLRSDLVALVDSDY